MAGDGQSAMCTMDPYAIIGRYYDRALPLYALLVGHGEAVARKALEIARSVAHFKPDLTFIAEAALLHDIGIFLTSSPDLGCHGVHPYLCHGYLGRKLLEEEGWPRHALVCERHVGLGFTAAEIVRHNLPLPHREMMPVRLEEKIICVADKFFSKSAGNRVEKPPEVVLQSLHPLGVNKIIRFLGWLDQLGMDADQQWRKLFLSATPAGAVNG